MKEESFPEVMDIFFNSKMDKVHTLIPGKIVSYDGHEKRRAEVKLMVKLRNSKNQIIEVDPIKNVPVMFPSTMDFNMLFPIKKDDGCLLLFAESCIGNFLLNSDNDPKEADDLNKFDLSDCICIPGLWSFKSLPDKPENDDDFFLIFQDASIQIKDSDNDIIIKNKKSSITLDKDGNVNIENEGDLSIKSDGTFSIEDGNQNKISSSSTGITIENSANTIELGASSVKINDTSLEVLP
jgi:hypothetical protein